MKKRYYILARVIGFLLIALASSVFVLQIPSVQTQMAREVFRILGRNLDADIRVGSIQIVPGNGLLIQDLLVIDSNPYTEDIYNRGWSRVDTVVSVSSIKARFSLRGILGGKPFKIRSVQVDDGLFALTSEPGGEGSSNLQRIFKLQPSGKKPGPESVFQINKAHISGFRFRLVNFGPKKKETPEIGFDWDNLDVRVNLKASDIHYTDGRMHGICDRLDAVAAGGYRIRRAGGSAVVGRGRTLLTDLHFEDDFSNLRFEHLTLNYADTKAFSNFTQEVSIDGEFEPTIFNFRSLQYFSGKKSANASEFEIERGLVSGPVSHLSLNTLSFTETRSRTSAYIPRLELAGLPELRDLRLDGKIESLRFSSEGLATVIGNFSATGAKPKLPEGIRADMDLTVSGTAERLAARLEGRTSLGSVSSNLDIRNLLIPEKDLTVDGRLDADADALGSFFKIKDLGEVCLSTDVHAVLGSQTEVRIDSLTVSKAEYASYAYSGINVSATLADGNLSGDLKVADPHLSMTAQVRSEGEGLIAEADIKEAGLAALGLAPKMEISCLRGKISADLESMSKELLAGKVILSDIFLAREDGQTRKISGLSVEGAKSTEGVKLNLDTEALTAFLEGNNLDSFRMNAELNDRGKLLGFFVPGLSVAENSSIQAMRRPDGAVLMRVSSPFISLGKNEIRQASVNIRNIDDRIDLHVGGEKVSLGSIRLDKPHIRIYGRYSIDDKDFTLETAADSSYIRLNGQRWDIDRTVLGLKGGNFGISGFKLTGPGGQSLSADGGVSKTVADTLAVRMKDFDLSILNSLMAEDSDIHGIVNGYATLFSPTSEGLRLQASLASDDLAVADVTAGKFTVEAGMDAGRLSAKVRNTLDGKEILLFDGEYDTAARDIRADASINGLNLGIAEPIFSDLFSQMGGRLYGNFRARGNLDNPEVLSDSLKLDDVLLRLKITNVPYTLNGNLSLSADGLSSESIRITDDEDGSGILKARFLFDRFRNPGLDANLAFTSLKLLGKDYDPNEGFYGRAYASGDVRISGPLRSMLISVNAMTAKQGQVHVPVGSALAAESKILTFRKADEPGGTPASGVEEGRRQGRSDIKIKANVNVRENTQALVEIDKSQGHAITVMGQGNVTLDIRPSAGVLDLGGVYNITGGKYHFSALSNIAVKDFTIQPGSAIKFNGKPKDSEFDITALYVKKANIAPLLTDTTSVSTSGLRTVECGLRIGNRISNPDLKFSINIPDLDPGTKSQVDGALNTEDKIQKQFVALVLTGSFIPADESGVTFNSGNAVFSNLSSIMSGQLNNILQTLNIPVDMGLNYQQTSGGKDMFDVAVSTQLFNNKVLVNGSVGSRRNSSSSSTDVVGDLDIEVKLNKSGQFRLKLFSHSADGYTNYLDNSQRNGVGLSYQGEFNNIQRFFRMILFRKKMEAAMKKAALERQSGMQVPDSLRRPVRPMKTISIDE
ncbi:MAG: translocation/assembly module TamB [Bacteroidales bacterium]|nr:translocation/assembly module TamB [Bacteroidales bacterium]